jgi:PKD repeat protein
MKKLFTLFLSSFLLLSFHAQTWVEMMQNPNANFYETKQAFEEYWQNRTIEKGKGYKQFKRWEHFMEERVYPSGDVKLPTQTFENYKLWIQELEASGTPRSMSGDWQQMGPVGAPANGGAGRLNFVRFHPNNSNILYVGAPDGGLWISQNGGTSWTTNTDQLAVIGCTDIAINPTNPQIMYLATGDGDAADSHSVGVLKSTDGGETWNPTGLTFTVNQGRTLSRLLINPNNPDILIAVGSAGIWRTTNAGANWTQVVSNVGFKDAEFNPTNPNVVYAAGTGFRRSTDGGATWTNVSLPLNSIGRISIAVSAANANYVYLLAANNSDNGYRGLMRSTDAGVSFTTRSTSPNLLGWDNGGDEGGQGWYDLTVAVSHTNAEEVFVGGVNMWRSTNGGTNWTLNSHWYGGFSKPYVHADIHDIMFLPGSGSTLFSANDGGLFKSTNNGSTWTDISSNLTIAQQYRIGLSASNANLLLAGHQDNGTNRLNGTTWAQVYGGDGMDCFIDRTNNQVMYGSYVYGDFYRSTNGGNNWTSIANLPAGDWLCAWHQDPVNANTIYAGGRPEMYRSTNQGTAWTALGTPPGNGNIREFEIAPSNNQIIYALKTGTGGVSKSTNAGTSFTSVSTGLPTSLAPTDVAISNTNPNVVFVTYSGYTSGNKVYQSTNGGTSWTNISTGLPNVACNTIVYENNSPVDAVYVGTDIGVFYRDNTMSTWIEFSTNLPRVAVRDLEIFYPTGRLRAGTYGRGTWDSDLYSTEATGPIASFTSNTTTVCQGESVQFTNTSIGDPETFAWTFTGGTPSTSTLENPMIQYTTPGTYTVELIASNADGSGTSTQVNYITVLGTNPISLPINEGFVSATFPPANWTIVNENANPTTWVRNSSVGIAPTAGNSMFFDNYNFDDSENEDEIILPAFDLSSATSASLSFDVAYAPYDVDYFDGLRVKISSNCGGTYQTVFEKSGTVLATAPTIAGFFTPTDAQWRNEVIDLTPFLGQGNVQVSFVNLAGWGNALYVDNINIVGNIQQDPPVASFTTSSNEICAGQTIQLTNTSTGGGNTYQWNLTGSTTPTSTAVSPSVMYDVPGIYSIELIATNQFGSNTMLQSSIIEVLNSPVITSTSPAQSCGQAALTLTAESDAGTISWFANPSGGTSLATGSSFTTPLITTSTTYYVEANNGQCSSQRVPVMATINALPSLTIQASESIICVGNSTSLTASGANTYVWDAGLGTNATISVSPTVTTTYSVTGTNSQTACSNTASVTIQVTDQLNLTIQASQNEVCAGEPVVLTASGASTYSWSPGGQTGSVITVNPTTTTSYTVTGVQGCTGTTSITITITPAPQVSLDNISSVCLTDNSFTLNSGSPAGGTYTGNGIVNNTFNPIDAGVGNIPYSYQVTQNGCSGIANAIIVVDECLSIDEVTASVFIIYPNPSEGFMTIHGDNLLDFIVLTILDQTGKRVHTENVVSKEMQLNLTHLAAGQYKVMLSSPQKEISKSIVIVR